MARGMSKAVEIPDLPSSQALQADSPQPSLARKPDQQPPEAEPLAPEQEPKAFPMPSNRILLPHSTGKILSRLMHKLLIPLPDKNSPL